MVSYLAIWAKTVTAIYPLLKSSVLGSIIVLEFSEKSRLGTGHLEESDLSASLIVWAEIVRFKLVSSFPLLSTAA